MVDKGKEVKVVEFFGLPGSGKSTVYNHLEKSMIKHGYTICSREFVRKWGGRWSNLIKAKIFLCNLVWIVQLIMSIISPLSFEEIKKINYKRVRGIIIFAICIKYFVKNEEYTYLIMHEGLFQKIWSLYFDLGREVTGTLKIINNIQKYFKISIIHLKVSPRESSYRIYSRNHGTSRFDNISNIDLTRKRLEEGEKMINNIISEFNCNEYNCIEINGTNKEEINAGIIRDWLKNKY